MDDAARATGARASAQIASAVRPRFVGTFVATVAAIIHWRNRAHGSLLSEESGRPRTSDERAGRRCASPDAFRVAVSASSYLVTGKRLFHLRERRTLLRSWPSSPLQ